MRMRFFVKLKPEERSSKNISTTVERLKELAISRAPMNKVIDENIDPSCIEDWIEVVPYLESYRVPDKLEFRVGNTVILSSQIEKLRKVIEIEIVR